ncbi:MAG: 7,8-didemethyl-8-hydroxy-5-deazariboflavin synthase subunit CofG [Solirubrobacteraceae bacterium]|nr:7,8-didemethyl-8-hydroxy-5-deazariboflavin synthase subunit CofG [Solirubrobacteraceae bacterium]
MARRVTYSRNITLSLSRSCQCVCKYCAFATRKAHLRTPAEVELLIDRAARRGVKELLVLTGEGPDTVKGVSEQLAEWGHGSFLDYVVWACERGLDAGMLPHTNLGVLEPWELERLREVTASQGLMLESSSERLMETVHAGSPTKHPERRLATIRAAGELRIPFTSGVLLGIGETREERFDALRVLGEVQAEYGHLQEIIVQNFVPHRRYYGEDTGAVATEAAEAYWRTGLGTPPALAAPDWANPIDLADLIEVVAAVKDLVPGAQVQVPPNLSEHWPELVRAGATDLGGLSSNGDHISPEHPFPSPKQVRERLAPDGVSVAERLCAHEAYLTPEWISPAVMDVVRTKYWSFLPWVDRADGAGGSGSEAGDGPATDAVELGAPGSDGLAAVLDRAASGDALSHAELTALLSDRRPEVVEDVRQAADALRAELCGEAVTFVVNRNLNLTNVCTVGCAFCGFGQSKRSPEAYTLDELGVRARLAEAVAEQVTELCIQSGIHPDWDESTYVDWLRLCKLVAPEIHLHAFSPMELDAMLERSGLAPAALLSALRDAGLGSIPGTAAEILDDEVRKIISPNKLPAARWVELIGAAHAAGIPTTSTVMFGHVEQARHLATHLQVVRGLAERSTAARIQAADLVGADEATAYAFAGAPGDRSGRPRRSEAHTGPGEERAPAPLPARITEFVPLRFIPHQTLLGRTKGVRELDAEETLRLTAVFRLGLGRSIPNLQTSWVKLGIDLATESLRWGVNDLGGTLMEENISRLAGADHGVRLDPAELVAAAHAAGRPAAERSTLYAVRAEHPLPLAVSAP